MVVKFTPFDASKYFVDDESRAILLADAFESGDIDYITHALGVLAKAKGMTEVAKVAGVSREALYKSLGGGGDPKLSTLLGVAKALGFKLLAERASENFADTRLTA